MFRRHLYILITFFLFISSCHTDDKKNTSSEFTISEDLPYYHNNIDEAFKASKLSEKPILIHFTNWATSNRDFHNKILKNETIRNSFINDFILLDLMCDDKKAINLKEYSNVLNEIGLTENKTVGSANTSFKNHLLKGIKTNSPVYLVVNSRVEILGEHWEYTSDFKFFHSQMYKAIAKQKERLYKPI